MRLTVILLILIAHWYADFVRQTNEMALGKSKWQWPFWRYPATWKPLASHVGMYTPCLWGTVTFAFLPLVRSPDLGRAYSWFLVWVFVNGALHFLTDMWTSRWTSSLWFIPMVHRPVKHLQGPDDYPFYAGPVDAEKRHLFFIVIGFDQLLHAVCLFVTASWWLP